MLYPRVMTDWQFYASIGAGGGGLLGIVFVNLGYGLAMFVSMLLAVVCMSYWFVTVSRELYSEPEADAASSDDRATATAGRDDHTTPTTDREDRVQQVREQYLDGAIER